MAIRPHRAVKPSQIPGTAEYRKKIGWIPRSGYIHPEYNLPQDPALHGIVQGQMQAAKEQWRALSMPGMYAAEKAYQAGLPEGAFLAPGTGGAAYGTAIRVGGAIPALTVRSIPTLTAQSIASRTTGTTASRAAGIGIAGGGTALARGGPSVGTVPGGGLDLSGVGSSISSAGSSMMNMVRQYLPLAVKVVLAVIVIKIILWLVRGRSR